ncbi:MAG: DUF1631 family protein [Rhodocyclales bacterium]|nr:DUF1631 family protein [Rhodocyclales bacterium]
MSHTETPTAAAPPAPNRAAVIAEVRELFLDRVEKAIRTAGVDAPVSIAALRAGAVQLLDQMTTEGARTGFALANSLTASQIRLVDDNQLELSIRLGDISKHLRDECAGALYKFHQRFVTLIDRPLLRVADDPLSPEAICRSLAEMFGSADTAHQSTLARLADIETHLANELPLMYAELAELLSRRQIAPAKLQAAAAETRGAGHRRGADGADVPGDAMAALQRIVLARLQPAGGVSVVAGDSAPRFEQIMGQLDQWQAQTQSDLFGGSAAQVAENALHALKTSEAMARLRAQDAVALDVLSALFDALFDDLRLSPAVKAAVARLQIPVLKAAILGGATFFTDPDHPARALLAAMGQATIGLESDIDAAHPVCAEIQRIAAGVQGEFQRDTEVFDRYGAQLESFMAHRHHDLQASAPGFIALAKVQEEHDIALRSAWRLVASRTLSVAPRAVADFLREHWTKVLATDWLYGGQRSEQWQADERVLEDLLWSIQPKSEAEDRRRLGQLVPDLLARLKAGLDRIGIQGEARAPFLEACFALQAAAIRGRSIQTAAPNGPAADSVDGDTLVVMESNGVTLKSLRSANPDARASGDVVRDLVIGDWVEFVMPDGSLRCGRLCWISPELGNPLFMNSAWDCAISVARSSLERQFAAGQASTGSTLSFFDNAIEKALHKSIPARP